MNVRDLIRNEVLTILTCGKTKEKRLSEAKAQQVAIYLEKKLYVGSSSYSEYSDLETLQYRLKKVVSEGRLDCHRGDVKDQITKVQRSYQEVESESHHPVFFSSSQGHLVTTTSPNLMINRRFHKVTRSFNVSHH
jgi:hypothetical protein